MQLAGIETSPAGTSPDILLTYVLGPLLAGLCQLRLLAWAGDRVIAVSPIQGCSCTVPKIKVGVAILRMSEDCYELLKWPSSSGAVYRVSATYIRRLVGGISKSGVAYSNAPHARVPDVPVFPRAIGRYIHVFFGI